MSIGMRLQVLDTSIDIHANSAELVEELSDYYRPFVVPPGEPADLVVHCIECPIVSVDLPFEPDPPGPGKTRIKDETCGFSDGRILRKRLTGMHFVFAHALAVAVGPCRQNLNQIVNFVNNRFMERYLRQGCLLVHAAGVVGDDGLAIAGMSGGGKSTLAMFLLNRGMNYVSNDRLLIKRGGRGVEMIGVPKWPRVNPGTIIHNDRLWPLMEASVRRRFEVMPREELWDLEDKFDAPIPALYGSDRLQLQCRLSRLVILNWAHVSKPARMALVQLDSRRDLLPAIMKAPGVHFWPDESQPFRPATEQEYIDELADCPVLECTGGVDFQAAVALCLNS